MVQTTYDIIKAHGGELKVETKDRSRGRVYNTVTNCLNRIDEMNGNYGKSFLNPNHPHKSYKSWFREKAHGGELKVETKEGKAEFIIV